MNAATLHHFKRGEIYDPAVCPHTFGHDFTHAVLLVGYGLCKKGDPACPHETIPFWVLKNSWGQDWGDDGFFRMRRGNNVCGVMAYPVSVLIDS